MIFVTNGNEVEPLTQISNFEMQQEVNGAFTVSFVAHSTTSNPAYSILKEESIVSVEGYDFRVKQLKETRHGKQITAINTYFDSITKWQDGINGGTRSFKDFAEFALSGTGWKVSTNITEMRMIENFGHNNAVALIEALCKVYQCEYMIYPNNVIHFSKQIGGDYDAQYRYGHNVKALSKNVDTTNLRTYIEGYGAVNENGGGQLFVSYESPNAAKFGKLDAEPVYDDRFTQADSLLDHIKGKIIDYPEATFELDSIELVNKELGERVWLIYEPLNIEFQTRILSQTKKFINGELRTVKVVLGNTMPKSTTDILISQKVEIDENKKITRSKFEQTNSQITLAVETIGESIAELKLTDSEISARVEANKKSIAEVNIRADKIELGVTDQINQVNSRITQEASRIDLRVDNTNNNLATTDRNLSSLTVDVNGISTKVSTQGNQIDGLGNRVGATETSITQTNNRITLETRGDNLVSKINMDSSSVSISANKINLNGAVMVNGSIYGATDINVTRNITVGNTINMTGGYNKINFSDMTAITSDGAGSISIDLWNDLSIQSSRTTFWGNVDFSYANVTGLNVSSGDASSVNGISFFQSSNNSKVLVVRRYGSDIGYISMN